MVATSVDGVKGSPGSAAQPIRLKPDERVSSIRPEYHVRRGRDGKHRAYICEDREGRVIMAQKLPELARYCTKLAGDNADQTVTMTSLYAILKVRDGCGRTQGWSKHRWRVRPYNLGDEAVRRFESLRQTYPEAVVLGSPYCLTTRPLLAR